MARRLKSPGGARSLRLYVSGNAPNSLSAIANAREICKNHPGPPYDLEIVDLLKYPERALSDRIIVTPTLLRVRPLPTGRVVGNLSDTHQVSLLLGSK